MACLLYARFLHHRPNTCFISGPVCVSSKGVLRTKNTNNGDKDSRLNKPLLNQIARKTTANVLRNWAMVYGDHADHQVYNRYSQRRICPVQSRRSSLVLRHPEHPQTRLIHLKQVSQQLHHQGTVQEVPRSMPLPPSKPRKTPSKPILKYPGGCARGNTIGDLSMPSRSTPTPINRHQLPLQSATAGPRSWRAGCAKKPSKKRGCHSPKFRKRSKMVEEPHLRHASALRGHCNSTKSTVS